MAVSLPPDGSSFFTPADGPTPPRFLHADSRSLVLGGRRFSVEIVNDGGEARRLTAQPMESGWRVLNVVPSAVVPSRSQTTLTLERQSFASPRGHAVAADQFAFTYTDVTGYRFVTICKFEAKTGEFQVSNTMSFDGETESVDELLETADQLDDVDET